MGRYTAEIRCESCTYVVAEQSGAGLSVQVRNNDSVFSSNFPLLINTYSHFDEGLTHFLF